VEVSLRNLIGLAVAGFAVAAVAVVSAPAASAAAPATSPGAQCGNYVYVSQIQFGSLKYNVDIAFEAGLDVPRVVGQFTSGVRADMTRYSYCDRYADVKALITQANSQLPRIDAVALADGNAEAILAEAPAGPECLPPG
jgi:NAD(P)-dependent dehydrogenase (short-subunit alcohol dehydrogenase family)